MTQTVFTEEQSKKKPPTRGPVIFISPQQMKLFKYSLEGMKMSYLVSSSYARILYDFCPHCILKCMVLGCPSPGAFAVSGTIRN